MKFKECPKIMSNKFDSGFNRAFSEIVVGLIIQIIISSFFSIGLIPSYFIWFFHLLSIIDMLSLIKETSFWATSYVVGWLFGVIILTYSGLLTIIDFLIYLIPLGLLVYKMLKPIRD